MILTLTASIMYWYLKQPVDQDKSSGTSDSETISNSTLDDSASESSIEENGNLWTDNKQMLNLYIYTFLLIFSHPFVYLVAKISLYDIIGAGTI